MLQIRLQKWICCCALLSSVFLASPLNAQLPTARLSAISPPGAKAGGTLDITVSGTDLDLASGMLFSHPGIKAAAKTRDPSAFEKGPQPVPNTFVLTVAADVPVGTYEARVVGRFGVSTSRFFQISDLNEMVEKEANNTLETATEVPLESVVNAASNGGGDLDFYKVALKAGQRMIADCSADAIDSRLDATMALLDASGKQLAASRDYRERDPVIDFTAPADGVYYLKVNDVIYGGGGEHFYRLQVSTRPYVDFLLPPCGLPGTKGDFVLYGRNLPGGQPGGIVVDGKELQKLPVQIDVPGTPEMISPSLDVGSRAAHADAFEYRLRGPNGVSNPLMVGFASAPIVQETEPNQAPAAAQKITAPCEFVGRLQAYRDVDVVEFEAKTGQVFMIESISHRAGSPADAYFLVQRVAKNEKGEEQLSDVGEVDDSFPNVGGISFNTQSDDGALRFATPADGTYRVTVRDRGYRGGPRYVYRLAIRPEKPDFRLVAVPRFPNNQQQTGQWSPLLRRGGSEIFDVFVLRRDGFNDEVQITVAEAKWAELRAAAGVA